MIVAYSRAPKGVTQEGLGVGSFRMFTCVGYISSCG